jgi:hypothetical protein
MAAIRFRTAFDPGRDFVTKRDLRFNGKDVPAGRRMDKKLVTPRRLRQLFDQRAIAYPDETGRDLARPVNPTRVGTPRVVRNRGPVKSPADGVPIPADWMKLSWPKRLKLAETLSGGKVADNAEAKAVIERELSRRR